MSDEEWAFVAPYLTLLREDAGQRVHPLRELPTALAGMHWLAFARPFAQQLVREACFKLMKLSNSFALIVSFAAFRTSLYGWLVIGKVALFAGMVGLGALNKGLVEQEPIMDVPATVRRLWRNVTGEGMAAVGVLLLTAALAMSTPPAAGG